ncbi:MAG: SRPBCC family protein [Polyangiaceae bacterium]|nr:SRPBCC family protein [Polyangiaceae bacterium]
MATFARSIVIDAPRTWLFDTMQDYGRRLEWDSFLARAALVGGAEHSGLGVSAECVDHAGRAMITEYVSFKRPERVAVKMTKGPWMFASFAGSWVYRELAAGRTEVTFRYSMELRPRLLGALGDRALAGIFSADMKRRLASAKERLEGMYAAELRRGAHAGA